MSGIHGARGENVAIHVVMQPETDTGNVPLRSFIVLYRNIVLKLRNALHGPIHYKIGVTCVFNEQKIYTLL